MYKIVMISCLLVVCLPVSAQNQHETRLDEVAERGRHVMPFDLEQTCHIFSKTPQGGVQQVIVKDQANAPQIALIQAHLRKIAHEFNLGDFSGPAKIHGNTMPGLATLRKATPTRLTIRYQPLANGAQITFTSDEAELIAAIHLWFDAQLSDHARHAHSGRPMK